MRPRVDQFQTLETAPHWLAYFINGDAGSLDTEDRAAADAWTMREGVAAVLSAEHDSERFTWAARVHVPELDCDGASVVRVVCRMQPNQQWEYTDTYGGEANYCWVKRRDVYVPTTMTDRAVIRAAKAWAGINGVRATTCKHGDLIEIRPRHAATVLFIQDLY